MSLRFTMSRDGTPRATVVVRERLDATVFVEAVAQALGAQDPEAAERISKMGASEFEHIARGYMRGAGYDPNYWPEQDDEEIEAARDAAMARARELWPGAWS